MTLTIYKDDDFKNQGFKLTESVYNKQFLRKEETDVFNHGVHGGWSKEVPVTPDNINTVLRIMLMREKISNLSEFRRTIFDVLNENDFYKGQGVKMETIDKEIERINKSIEHALERLK